MSEKRVSDADFGPVGNPLDAIRRFFSDSAAPLEDREQKLWEWFVSTANETRGASLANPETPAIFGPVKGNQGEGPGIR